jgi:hypothetical protein
MVRACSAGASDETVARVQRATDGIPFLVEEVLASPGSAGVARRDSSRQVERLSRGRASGVVDGCDLRTAL